MSVKLAKAIADAGQTLMLAASNSDNDYSYLITLQDGKKMAFTAKSMSFKTTIGTVNSILGAEVNLEINSDIVEY